MRKKPRIYKNTRALAIYSFLQLLTLLLWEHALQSAPLYAHKILIAGSLVSVYAAGYLWFSLKQQYQHAKRRHVFSKFSEPVIAETAAA